MLKVGSFLKNKTFINIKDTHVFNREDSLSLKKNSPNKSNRFDAMLFKIPARVLLLEFYQLICKYIRIIT